MKKYLGIFVALMLALSLTLVPAAVSAEPDGIELTREGNGISEQSDDVANSGSYSVKLILPAGYTVNDYAHAGITMSGETLNEVSASYWYYPSPVSVVRSTMIKDYEGAEITAYFAPFLVFELDADGLGGADTWVIQYESFSQTTGSWQEDVVANEEPFHIISIIPGYTYPYGTSKASGTLTEVKAVTGPSVGAATLGEATVLKVKIETGGWNSVTQGIIDEVVSYVDDITIDGILYAFDPTGSVILAGDISGITAISVTPTSIDFGTLYLGQSSSVKPITVSNVGGVAVAITTSVEDEVETFFADNLWLDGVLAAAYEAPLGAGNSVTLGAKVIVPPDYPLGPVAGTLIFTATAAAPSP